MKTMKAKYKSTKNEYKLIQTENPIILELWKNGKLLGTMGFSELREITDRHDRETTEFLQSEVIKNEIIS